MTNPDNQTGWTEDLSKVFMDYGRYFVPDREHQIHILAGLLEDVKPLTRIVELCCGEGLLAEAILATYPTSFLLAFDGSKELLVRAQSRLARYKNHFQCQIFNLAATDWGCFDNPVNAIVSSMAVHHLPGPEKHKLFRNLFRLLAPGGAFVIADILEVVGVAGRNLASEEWDQSVHDRSSELDGNDAAYRFFRKEKWNMHRYLDPDDIDKPSPIFSQLKWLEKSGFIDIDVNWLYAGHAIFSARKPGGNE